MLNYEKLRAAIRLKIGDRTAKSVAPKIGIAESTLSRLLSGSGLSVDNYGLICDWLGCPLDEFWDSGQSTLSQRMLRVASKLEEFAGAKRPIDALMNVLREEFGGAEDE